MVLMGLSTRWMWEAGRWIPEPLGALTGLWMQEEGSSSLSQRSADCPHPIPPHPMATVLVNKEHSSEGTYVLLFLGD